MVLLVINLGLKSVRCIAFSFDGTQLSQASRPIHTYVSNENVEQDPFEWHHLTWDVVREVTSNIGTRYGSVCYMTVTTSASCLVALDHNGAPLRNSILVSDTRSVDESRLLANTFEFQAVHASTGLKSSPDLMLPKILWMLHNEPEIVAKVDKYVNVGDYLVAKLTGQYVTDPNNALKFHYSLSEATYPKKLLKSLGIATDLFPDVMPLGTVVGKILPNIADELGCPADCQVVLSTYDALAAVIGTGVFDVGEAVDVSGTVTSFRAVTNHHIYDPLQRIYVVPHIGVNRWLAGGSNNLGGGIIEWMRQLLFEKSQNPYTEMQKVAENQGPCPGGLIFLPYLLGERTPIWNPNCRGVFFGLNRAHSQQHLVRAIFESVGFSIRHIAQTLNDLHVPINTVTVSGGLSRIDIANQIKADILGVPVRRLSNFETTSIGAAIIALVGIGVFKSGQEAFKQFCHVECTYEPNMNYHAVYDDFFELYLNVYESLIGAYDLRAKLVNKLHLSGIQELVLTENL